MADSVQYSIDIAANLNGGEATAAQLDAIADRLSGVGANSAQFEDAIQRVTAQLDRARTASDAANAALADGQAEYVQLERAALKAAKAAERAALKNGGVVPDGLAAEAAKANSALDAYTGNLRDLEQAAERAAKAQQGLSNTAGNLRRLQARVNDRLGDATTKMSTFRGALGDVGGPLGEFGERLLFPAQALVDLRERFGSVVAYSTVAVVGIAAVAAAVVALGAALAAGVVQLTVYGVKLADTARQARLTQQALEAHEPAIAGVSASYAGITNATGQTTEQLNALTRSLKDAKVSAQDMPAALRAAALAEAALGQGGAASFVSDIKAGKLAVDEFAATTQRKFGDVVARQMLGLEQQSARFERNVSGLFDGLDIDPVLLGMRTLVSLFDENTTAGRFLKRAIEGLLQPLIDQAQTAAWVVEAFFLGLAIGALRLYLGLKPAIDRAKELLGVSFGDWDLEDVLRGVAKAGEYAAPFLLGVAAGVLAIGAALLVTTAVAMAPLLLLIATVVVVGVALWKLVSDTWAGMAAFSAAWVSGVEKGRALLSAFAQDAVGLGANIVAGLARGITGAAGQVTSAVTGAVGGAIAAAKRQLGIASPSKVFAEIGENTGMGFAGGVEDTTGDAQSAISDLVSPRDARLASESGFGFGGGSAHGSDARGSDSGPASVSIRDNTFHFYGVEGVADVEQRIEKVFTRLLRGDADNMAGASV